MEKLRLRQARNIESAQIEAKKRVERFREFVAFRIRRSVHAKHKTEDYQFNKICDASLRKTVEGIYIGNKCVPAIKVEFTPTSKIKPKNTKENISNFGFNEFHEFIIKSFPEKAIGKVAGVEIYLFKNGELVKLFEEKGAKISACGSSRLVNYPNVFTNPII